MEPITFNKLITQAMEEIKQDRIDFIRKEKISLIEDIFKAGRLAYGMEIPGNDVVIKDPVKLFDVLYDMSNGDLEIQLAQLSAEISMKARELAGFKQNETTFKR